VLLELIVHENLNSFSLDIGRQGLKVSVEGAVPVPLIEPEQGKHHG